MADAKDPAAPGSTQTKAPRVVFVGVPSAANTNRSLSTTVAGTLYDAFVECVAEKHGTVDFEGRKALRDGAMATALREAVAAYAGYDYSAGSGHVLAYTSKAPSSAVTKARGMVGALFSGLRGKHDYAESVTIARATLMMLDVSLTDQEFQDLWEAAADDD